MKESVPSKAAHRALTLWGWKFDGGRYVHADFPQHEILVTPSRGSWGPITWTHVEPIGNRIESDGVAGLDYHVMVMWKRQQAGKAGG